MKKSKLQLLRNAVRIKAEIEQIFIDCASYNENHLPAGASPIDIDPDGELQRSLTEINDQIISYCN